MKKNSIIYFVFIGLVTLFSACEKDGDKVIMKGSPTAPAITTMPDLTLTRATGTNMLEFVISPVDPGFTASANYFVEAAVAGTNFADPVIVLTSPLPGTLKISVSDLNGILLKKLPGDQVSAVELRVRSVLIVDAGTGAVGTSSNPLVFISDVKPANVTLYGLPRLDFVVNNQVIGKVESALGNGSYTGFVKLDNTKAFTIKDPDSNITYGKAGETIVVNGAATTHDNSGWHQITVNTNDKTISIAPYMVAAVGEFTDWGNQPDKFMDYDTQNGYWYTTLDLPAGPMKFRLNSAWASNWGPGSDMDLPADGKINLPNSNGNIRITSAGSYTITFTVNGSTGSATFTKN